MNTSNKFNRRHALVTAVSLALGTGIGPQIASAAEYSFEWTGYFIMLDSGGNCLDNTSLPIKGNNQCVTPISGTLVYDDVAETGSMVINEFQFFNGNSTQPATATGIDLGWIGDGAGGTGTLMLSNMLFDWNGSVGIPVSLAFDADGIIDANGDLDVHAVGDFISSALDAQAGDAVLGTDVLVGAGAVPASDGTFVAIGRAGAYEDANGYLAMGAMPLATTAWNTTAVAGCVAGVDADYTNNAGGGCMNTNPSGAIPLVVDVAANTASDGANPGGTIGGNPMADGPFTGFNATFAVSRVQVTSIGNGPTFTPPVDPDDTVAGVPGDIVPVDLGTVTDEAAHADDPTCNVTVEYDIGNGWTADDGTTNTENVTLTGTVTTVTVDWRATTTAGDPGTCSTNSTTLGTQTVTVTINDVTAPTFTVFPADFSVSVDSTAESISFEGPTSGQGTVTVSDAVDSDPLIEWSLDGLNWTADTAGTDESSTGFGSGANTVYWRVTDAAGNERTQQQTVTVNLPTGIVGQPCTVDADLLNAAIGDRLLEGTFTMRDPAGSIVGTIDPFVTGSINTATVCANESCTDSGAALASPTPFYGNLWTTNTIRLFNQPGTYSFNVVQDGNPSLSMDVGANQLGAHMLFDWSVNRDIDVVLVWDYGCGSSELVTTDPDGDGIIGTRMVDGPFKGFNAAFDLSTQAGEQSITTGGYAVTVPVVNNTTAGASPVTVDPGTIGTALGGVTMTADDLIGWGASEDSRVVTSCVGGCFDFSVSGRTAGETIQVVLPLSTPIPWYSLYRKYDAGTDSWTAFVTNTTDSVKTAPLDADGRCPEPGAGDYTAFSSGILAGMLRPDDQCVQLTITDNGPNDDDSANGVIADPSGVGVTSAPATPETATSGGGCTLSTTPAAQRLDLWLLAGLMGLFGLRRKAQQ